LLRLWRNDHHQVFKGKFSSGATPKLSKDLKAPESPVNLLKANKKIKKSLFSSNMPKGRKEDDEYCKENLGDSFNMALEPEFSKDRTPSPKRKTKDHFNTMSIKKERKIFNKMMDLDMDEECCGEEMRYMTTSKVSKSGPLELNVNSRFVNDYEVIEVTKEIKTF